MNQKRLVYLIIFLISCQVFLSNCKKKNDSLIISGIAINKETWQPVQGMNVLLSARTISNGTWSSQFNSIDNQLTSSDGSFNFKFDNIRASDFKLTFQKAGYISDEYIIQPNLLVPGKDYHQNYLVHFESWLKIMIKNYSPSSVNDVLSYRLLKGSLNCPNGCNDSLKYLFGANVDTYHLCKLHGSQNAIIEWNYSNNTGNSQHIDTIWIVPSDTTFYNIYY